MIKGHLDTVTSSGYVEGWALDTEEPTRAIVVSVHGRYDTEIGWGLAHRYRADLAAVRYGIGWCAFRVRVTAARAVRDSGAVLRHRDTGAELHRADHPGYFEDTDPPLAAIAEITASDPTVLESIAQLEACEEVFLRFIKRHGIDGFVRTAYGYVLGRASDPSGRAQYGRLLRNGAMTPFALLATLSESDEFKSRPRLLSTPNRAGFPFGVT